LVIQLGAIQFARVLFRLRCIASCWVSQKPVEEMYELHKSLGSFSP